MNISPVTPKAGRWSKLPAPVRYGIVGGLSATAALIVACGLLLFIGSRFGFIDRASASLASSSAAGTTPVKVEAALPAGTAEPAAVPEATVVRPTATPEPSATPRPTTTPDLSKPKRPLVPYTVPATDNTYYETVDGHVNAMGDALTEIGIHAYETSETPELVYETSWKIHILLYLTQLQTVNNAIRGMQPPPEAVEFHSLLADTTHLCDAAANHVTRGIDLMNENDMLNAALELESAYINMDECTSGIYEAAALYPSQSSTDF